MYYSTRRHSMRTRAIRILWCNRLRKPAWKEFEDSDRNHDGAATVLTMQRNDRPRHFP